MGRAGSSLLAWTRPILTNPILMSLEKKIFKNASVTHYFSSKFFPKAMRQDIHKLYSFFRVADDYVDNRPQNKKEFKILKTLWYEAAENKKFDITHRRSDSLNEHVVKNMLQLTQDYKFEPEWVDAFLDSMQADLDKKTYTSFDGSLWYVYGSAEIIGLMMAKIMGLPKKAMPYAALQGRAMQWINFIRDIDEDNALGRSYFPEEDLKKFGLKDLKQKTAEAHPKEFRDFMNFQLTRYRQWQREAEKGYKLIPKRLRIPIETAVDNFNWTALQIRRNPFIVYEKKVKPAKLRVVIKGLSKTLSQK
jgi:15-cis-phytoene synthase